MCKTEAVWPPQHRPRNGSNHARRCFCLCSLPSIRYKGSATSECVKTNGWGCVITVLLFKTFDPNPISESRVYVGLSNNGILEIPWLLVMGPISRHANCGSFLGTPWPGMIYITVIWCPNVPNMFDSWGTWKLFIIIVNPIIPIIDHKS